MAGLMLSNIEIKPNLLKDEKYKYLFTVDLVNQYVMQGMPFRDAYIKVGKAVDDGSYTPPTQEETLANPHQGSIHNLCKSKIKNMMEKVVESFEFEIIHQALENLLK